MFNTVLRSINFIVGAKTGDEIPFYDMDQLDGVPARTIYKWICVEATWIDQCLQYFSFPPLKSV